MRHLLWLCLALTACNTDAVEELLTPDEPDTGPAMVEVESEPETPIPDLETVDREAICAAWYTAVEDQVPVSTQCVFVGLAAMAADRDASDAEAVSACGENVTLCTRAAVIGETDLPALPTGPCFLSEPVGECTATVADLLPCLNAMADAAVGNVRALVTCQLAGTPEVDVPSLEAPDNSELMECGQVTLDCPGLFGAEAEE